MTALGRRRPGRSRPSAWRNVGPAGHRTDWRHRDRPFQVVLRHPAGAPDRFEAEIDGLAMDGRVLALDGERARLEVDGIAREAAVPPPRLHLVRQLFARSDRSG